MELDTHFCCGFICQVSYCTLLTPTLRTSDAALLISVSHVTNEAGFTWDTTNANSRPE